MILLGPVSMSSGEATSVNRPKEIAVTPAPRARYSTVRLLPRSSSDDSTSAVSPSNKTFHRARARSPSAQASIKRTGGGLRGEDRSGPHQDVGHRNPIELHVDRAPEIPAGQQAVLDHTVRAHIDKAKTPARLAVKEPRPRSGHPIAHFKTTLRIIAPNEGRRRQKEEETQARSPTSHIERCTTSRAPAPSPGRRLARALAGRATETRGSPVPPGGPARDG